jgi:hypothetical protein
MGGFDDLLGFDRGHIELGVEFYQQSPPRAAEAGKQRPSRIAAGLLELMHVWT